MRSQSVLILACLSLVGCGRGISDPFAIPLGPVPKLTIISGAGQMVPLGAEAVVRVRLRDSNGSPMAYQSVRFHYVETIPNQIGGGIITARVTGKDGVAEVSFTTTHLGAFTVTADYPECVRFGGLGYCTEEVVRVKASASGTIVSPG